jgi:hypothetical protein
MTTMTTTTERRRASSPGAMSASIVRLYLIALLATAYVVAWWLLGVRTPANLDQEARTLEPTPETSAEHGMATWFHDLPAAERPVVIVPAGWHIADRTTASLAASSRAAPIPVRVSPTRAGRIRTRSS